MMGYFSNATESDYYEAKYCNRCVNQGPPHSLCCWIWLQHMLNSHKECNKPDSILHVLIPRDDVGYNKQCVMFREPGK